MKQTAARSSPTVGTWHATSELLAGCIGRRICRVSSLANGTTFARPSLRLVAGIDLRPFLSAFLDHDRW
jgi:hypothetical protein